MTLRVLVAAQEFKGSLGAAAACEAIARGIAEARPGWVVEVVPLADGGPGFLDSFLRSTPAVERRVPAEDALGRPVEARYLEMAGRGEVVIEAAESNGLSLIAAEERDPLAADTEGVGELIRAAVTADTRRVIVGVGGTATSDGGAGMARRLGARLLDGRGRPLGRGVRPLLELRRIEWEPGHLVRPDWIVATDVRSPLLGPEGAAAVYAPQKGASPAEVAIIERALTRLSEVVHRDLGVDLAGMPGAGAGGGLAGGLVAFLGGRIESGFDIVQRLTRLAERIRAADIVVSGEGRFDRQSLQGKGPARVVELAREAGKRTVVFAGSAEEAGEDVITLSRIEPDPAACMENAEALLRESARLWALRLA